MKRRVLVTLLVSLVLASSFVFAQGSNESATTTSSAKKQYQMVLIPKLESAWFEPYKNDGVAEGKKIGVDVYQQAPAGADEAQQVRIIEDSINQGVNAVLVVPNDANSCVPAFKKARQQGIVVMTHESPNQPEADFDIEMINNVKFGERMLEEMVRLGGDSGEYAIYVGSLTVPAHNIWADAAIALAKAKYPKLTLVTDRQPVSEDRNAARQKTLELLTVHPNLKGILAFGSQGAPGAGQALREKGLTDKVTVLGTTSPAEAAPFLKDGSIDECVLWSSGDAAHAMVYLSKMILDGKKDQIKQGLEIPDLGTPTIDGMNIEFDHPLIVDASNCDQYNF
jgi:simple sugar transport system substrate-binding protein